MAGPAMASTCRPCWFWKDIRAALVITFSEPSTHCEVKSGGRPAHRHANEPGWAVAASAGDGATAVGSRGSVDERLTELLDRVKQDPEARQEYLALLEAMDPDDPTREQHRRALASRLF